MEERQPTDRNIISHIWTKVTSYETANGIVLSILVGVAAGFGAVLFWKLIGYSSWLFFNGGWTVLSAAIGKYYVILLPAIGGLIFGPIIYFGAREAKGEGPPEVMEAVSFRGGRIRSRVAAVKVLASSICIGSGGSVGREGPIVQIGASLGSTIGQLFHLSEEQIKTLVLCGTAGGISATFNAPLAGIVFALEVIAGRFITPRFGYIVISSVSADVIARIFLFTKERPTSFVVPQYSIVSYWELIPYALLGVIVGLVAVGFIRFFYKTEDVIAKFKIPEYLKPAAIGIIIGLIGFFFPQIFGVGYGTHYSIGGVLVERGAVEQALAGEIGVVSIAAIAFLKILATSLTLGSGGSGGVFAPSLFIGAMLGGAFGIGVHQLFPEITAASGAYALVGMGAFFASVVRGPITAIIILFELTLDYALILPLMIAVVISSIVARLLTGESIYTLRLLKRGLDIRQLEQTSPMRLTKVSEAMTRNFPTILPSTPVNELITRLRRTGHHGFPVVDDGGSLLGVVTLADVEAALSKDNPEKLTVEDIYTKTVITAYPDEYIHDVFVKLGTQDVGRIPVVERNDPKVLLGVLRRHDIVKAYAKATSRRSRLGKQAYE